MPPINFDDPEEMDRLTAPASPINPIPTTMYKEPAGPPAPAAANPFVSPIDPYEVLQKGPLGQAYRAAQQGATGLFNLAGKADVAAGIKTPEQAESRAAAYGPLAVNTAAGAGVPWGTLPLAGKAAASGILSGTESMLSGEMPGRAALNTILGATVTPAVEKVGEGVRYLGSAIPKKMMDLAQDAKITDWIKQRVPWWKDFDLSEMATSAKAKEALKQGYEDAFTAAREQIPKDAVASIPLEIANTLKLKGEGGMDTRFLTAKNKDLIQRYREQKGQTGTEAVDMVQVNAQDLLDKLPGSEGMVRGQILRGLEPIAGTVIPEAREAFRVGRGWQELANRGGIGKQGTFDAQTAQQALRKPMADQSLAQKALQPRGMNELEDIIQPPGTKPITSVTPNSLAWHLGLGGAGLLGGLGLHGLHGVAGGAAAAIPKPTFYRNVPVQLPAVQQARQTIEQALMRQMMQSSERAPEEPNFLQMMQ